MPFTDTPQANTLSSANAPAVQSELAAFSKRQAELLTQMAPLDAELLRLNALPASQQTDITKARISDLNKQIATIKTQMSANNVAESAAAQSSVPTDQLANATAKQALLSTILETVEKPTPGLLSIIPSSAAVKPADLITYMTLTQHLNPYGRKRQCDTDLENLMLILNKEMLNAIGDNNVLNGAVTSLVKSVL